jgi:hypothetical protein
VGSGAASRGVKTAGRVAALLISPSRMDCLDSGQEAPLWFSHRKRRAVGKNRVETGKAPRFVELFKFSL